MSPSRWLSGLLLAGAIGVRSLLAQDPSSTDSTPSQLFEKASPCVVKIVAKDEDDRAIGSGSGFVISANIALGTDPWFRRLVVTNRHVVRAAVKAAVEPSYVPANWRRPDYVPAEFGNTISDAAIEDDRADLAVLTAFGWEAPSLPLADDVPPPVGTPIFVISSPEGLTNTLSEGLVSAFRDFGNGETLMQITAPISKGSSGAPVLTADGKVVGVVVASHSEGQNLNFAVPVRALRRLLGVPPSHRPLWKGTSIRDEEEDAFIGARAKLNVEVCGDLLVDQRDGAYKECLDKIRTRTEAGDQLALVVKARDDYDRGFPDYCTALPTLKRAVQEKSCGDEFLAQYLLGKAMSETHFCCKCLIQKESCPSDELRAKCYDPAIPFLKKSTQLNPKFSPAFARLAEVYLATECNPEALVATEFLVSLVPNCWEAYLLRGKAFTHLRRIGAADEDFGTAVRLRPNWFDLYDQIARTYSHIEDRKAVDAASIGLSLPLPTNEKELEWRQQERLMLWYVAGGMYERLGDLQNAARAFEEAHRLSPGRIRPADIEERLARCRAGLPGDGKAHGGIVTP